jgi:integrase
MNDLEARLGVVMDFFGPKRDPRTIEPEDVREWAGYLARAGRRKPGTVRHYLNALSGLFRRAQEGLFVAPEYNPVKALVEKPTANIAGDAKFFEVPEAALLLEAARILAERDRKNATEGLYPIIATFLLTGGRKAEVLGLDVEDVSFDRKVIRFRPNKHRRLKTKTSHRTVPLWPQLREILQAYMFGGDQPRTAGLLFPSVSGERITNLRKSLDEMAKPCEMEAGEIRTRAFRHTYCSARLQTVERIIKPGMRPEDPDAWDYVEVPRDRVAREMGHGGTQLVARIYGHAPRLPYRADAVEYRVERHKEELGERLKALTAR